MGIVAYWCLVLDVGNGDGDAPLPLLRSVVDLVEGTVGHVLASGPEHAGDGRCEGGLSVVYMANSTHVNVWFAPVKPLLCHLRNPPENLSGAHRRSRTADPVLTKNVLYL